MALALRLMGKGLGFGAKAVGGAVTGVAGSCFRHMTSGLPHPTECGCIGALFYYLGLHDHRKFNLLVEIHELDHVPKSASLYLTVEIGRKNATTQVVKTKGTQAVLVEERLMLHVRQVDSEVTIVLYKKGMMKNTRLASVTVPIKEELIDKNFPKRTWYSLKAESGKTLPRVNISWFRLDSSVPTNQSPLLQQAMLIAQKEADEKGEPVDVNLGEMSQKERLAFFAHVLEGPLERLNPGGGTWMTCYGKAMEVKPDRWEWCFWDSAEQCKQGAEKQGSIPFLAISLVLPDRKDRNIFYVRYHDKDTHYDVFFRRLDRDRNLWSDGLYEFIEKLRAYRELCPTGELGKKGEGRGAKKGQKALEDETTEVNEESGRTSRKSGGKKSRRPSTTPRLDISTARRVHSPRATIPLKQGPNAQQHMLEEVMISTQSSAREYD